MTPKEKSKGFDQFAKEKFREFIAQSEDIPSQVDFAKYLSRRSGHEISTASLSTWLSGTREPTGDNAHAWARVFGPEVYEILGLPVVDLPNEELERLAREYYDLEDADREAIWAIIDASRERSGRQTAVAV